MTLLTLSCNSLTWGGGIVEVVVGGGTEVVVVGGGAVVVVTEEIGAVEVDVVVEVDSVTCLCNRGDNRKKRESITNNTKSIIIMGVLLIFFTSMSFLLIDHEI
ncbi:hypothetical protein BFU36_08905 [Sulfolobus sp. A20]|nr:hypothetical protein BFU36_08905 [Sulfolobus sp. A20]TRM75481.1 hypothetical protein DJ532_10125 [Sulfolobus sp. A20-N-F8]TRM77398.1 hypothetical protein DJ528_06750 [Sulfolobus sp. B5]TRM85046.1 hypothetical protein DJ522_02295 [Sulfolobus sp. F3]TRM92834.1 hypothetical protein DJ526_05060 [Sulfolobus sp. A20-N-G8]TRM97078.1 hypothetical protein DMP16_03945 [Sulfolobus sp. B1]TRN01135.1 hypothetical protein DJ530_06350 [Sulfolobus sp. E1]TRN04683.1 hypothetical protein DJ527_00225 [Sulfo